MIIDTNTLHIWILCRQCKLWKHKISAVWTWQQEYCRCYSVWSCRSLEIWFAIIWNVKYNLGGIVELSSLINKSCWLVSCSNVVSCSLSSRLLQPLTAADTWWSKMFVWGKYWLHTVDFLDLVSHGAITWWWIDNKAFQWGKKIMLRDVRFFTQRTHC